MPVNGKPLLISRPIGHASGPIASFSDGAKGLPLRSLVANIDPVQDLHGYDNPWPAGGGKNLLPPDKYQQSSSAVVLGQNDATSFQLHLTAGTYTVSITCVKAGAFYYRTSDGAENIHIGNYNVTSATFTLSETSDIRLLFYINVGVDASEISNAQLELGSTVTSYAPYSNICPISGWSAVNVWRTGKNLLDSANVANNDFFTQYGAEYEQGVTYGSSYTASGGTVSITRPNIDPAVYLCIGRCYANVPMTVSFVNSGIVYDIDCRVSNTSEPGSTRFYRYLCSSETSVKHTFTPTQDGYIYIEFYSASVLNGTATDIQLELGSTATHYESYSGTQYTIQLGQTIYGGTLDVTTGVLTVDRGYADLGDYSWTKDTSTVAGKTLFRTSILTGAKSKFTAICSNYPFVGSYSNLTDKSCSFIYDTRLAIEDSAYSSGDASAFKTAMSGVQLVYELATPITIQLTPTEVTTLLGQNNVWADSGDVDVEYLKQSLKYIGSYVR